MALLPAIGGLIATAQTLTESGKAARANADLKRLFSKRQAFQTPAEIFEILQMRQNDAQSGFSEGTMQYLTAGADRNLSSTLNVAARLGADPNQLSSVLDSYFQDIFKIGGESEMARLKKFDGLTNALQLVASNNEAEQISRDNLIKDQMQAAAQRAGAAGVGIQSGLNLALNALSLYETGELYNDKKPKQKSNGSSTTNTGTNSNPGQVPRTPSEHLQQQGIYNNP